MIKVLEIRPEPVSKSNGIDTYCQSLRKLFAGDSNIEILPVVNYKQSRTKLLHEVYDYKGLKAALEEAKPTHVHINGYTSFSVVQAFFAARRHGCKIIYTAHWHPFCHLQHPLRGKLFFTMFIKPFVKRWANVVTAINGEDYEFFHTFHKNVVQIPHWLSATDVHPSLIEKKKNMILFVGRVSDVNKGVEHIYHLPEGKYEIHTVGVGDIPIRSDIFRHINIPLEELEELYERASLLVVPSKYEAFSYVSLEALVKGTPILVSQGVRIADYLTDIKGCYVFNYHDYEAFVRGVEQAIGSIVDVDGVLRLFSPERVKDLYRSVFES